MGVMQMTTYETVYTPSDPNYPSSLGIPLDPAPPPARPLARATARPSANFSEYVLLYGKAQRHNLIVMTAGMVGAIGAMWYLDGIALIIGVAVAVGLTLGGAGSFLVTGAAHSAYTRHLSTTTTQTYTAPPPAGPAVRPFVASRNANGATTGRTVRAGRFQLPAATWAALFAAAESNDGRLTRDAATKALPRALYRDWAGTMAEFQRLGIVDGDGRVTADGWTFARRDVAPAGAPPYPNDGDAPAGAHSTHARRTHGAHGAAGAGV